MFRYLNLANQWPDLRSDGVVNDAGRLRLATVLSTAPLSGMVTPVRPMDAAGLSGPARVAIDLDGNVYVPDAKGLGVSIWTACDGRVGSLPSTAAEGSEVGRFKAPLGVAIGQTGALYIADSGNHRIQVLDLATRQVRDVWGQADPFGDPKPGSLPGQLNDPWDLTIDTEGFVYVSDHGNNRVQKFHSDGEVVSGFWDTMRDQGVVPGEAGYITIARIDGLASILVIDRAPARVLAYRFDGSFDAMATERWAALSARLPAGLVMIDDPRPPASDGRAPRILGFDDRGEFAGEMANPGATQDGLTLGLQGILEVRVGEVGVSALPLGHSYATAGSFLAGPFSREGAPVRWQRVQVHAEVPTERADVQLFTFTADAPGEPPPLPPPGEQAISIATPSMQGVWRPAPLDGNDFMVLHAPARYLWIRGLLKSDGHDTPVLHQVRLEYDEDGWLPYLPAVYAREANGTTFVERLLALFAGLLGDVQQSIADLPRLFDSGSAPDTSPDSWLDWLAATMGFELDEKWASAERRQAVARAFGLLARRGTVQGLREMVALYTGTDVGIEEPGRFASVWSLGQTSTLGFSTQLAAAEPQGAVVGTTAVASRSHLIAVNDYGAPLFEDLAHRFCVHVPAAALAAPGMREALVRVLEREKPAHTAFALSAVEPCLRIGMQATLGVDAFVSGPMANGSLGVGGRLGTNASLPGGGLRTDSSADLRVGINMELS